MLSDKVNEKHFSDYLVYIRTQLVSRIAISLPRRQFGWWPLPHTCMALQLITSEMIYHCLI